jgi:hypothetical protein
MVFDLRQYKTLQRGVMHFTIYLADRYHAGIRQSGGEGTAFWTEMEFVHWYLIRVLSEFYESPLLLPDSLAAVYIDREFLTRFLSSDDAVLSDLSERLVGFRILQKDCRITPYAGMREAEMELELIKEARDNRKVIGEINSGIIRKPVILDRTCEKESPKFIRAAFPECRVEFRGFGRFLGYSDLNPILFWTPLLVLKYFYTKYIPAGGEIIPILAAVSRSAGWMHAARRIGGDNHHTLASEGTRAVMKRYAAS